MNAGRVVLIVDPYSSGNLLAPAFRAEGFVPVAVTSSAEPPGVYVSSYQPDDFEQRFAFDGDPRALVERLRPLRPIAVVPGAETGVELADVLGAELAPDFANVPGKAAARRHKGEMVKAVAAGGLRTIRTAATKDPSEVADWIAREGLAGKDLILKPPKSGGTDGLAFAPGGRGWREAFEHLLATPNTYGYANEQVVVQEYITGTEYAIDTFSHEGRHTFSDICRYRKLRDGDHMAVYESMEFLPYDVAGHGDVFGYVEKVLDALGIRFGAAHTEVMVTENGPYLIESGARLAGGGLPWTCALATGENSIDRMVAFLKGDRDIRKDFSLELPVIVVFFIAESSGIVTNVEVLDSIRELASCQELDVLAGNGDRISKTTDLWSMMQVGWTLLANTDTHQLYADHLAAREIQRQLVIRSAI